MRDSGVFDARQDVNIGIIGEMRLDGGARGSIADERAQLSQRRGSSLGHDRVRVSTPLCRPGESPLHVQYCNLM